MAAGQYDKLIIEQGATFVCIIGWFNNDNELHDLTTYEARMQVRKSHKSPATILDIDSSSATVLLYDSDGMNGEGKVNIYIEVAASVTADIVQRDLGVAVWDLEVESDAGQVFRLAEGKCLITPEVTR